MLTTIGKTSSRSQFTAWLMVLLCTSLFFVRAAIAEEQSWTDTRGRTIKAEFIRATGDTIVVKFKGQETSIPRANLSPESQTQAILLETKQPAPTHPDGTPVEERTWTNRFGNQWTGAFAGMEGNVVVVRHPNGVRRTTFNALSDEDQTYVRDVLTARNQQDLIPADSPLEQAGPPNGFPPGFPGPPNGPPNGPPGRPPFGPRFGPSGPGGPGGPQGQGGIPSGLPGSEVTAAMQEAQQRAMEAHQQMAEKARQDFAARRQEEAERERKLKEEDPEAWEREQEEKRKRQEEAFKIRQAEIERQQMEEERKANELVATCESCKTAIKQKELEQERCPYCSMLWRATQDADGKVVMRLNENAQVDANGMTASEREKLARETAAQISQYIVIGVGVLFGLVALIMVFAIVMAIIKAGRKPPPQMQRYY